MGFKKTDDIFTGLNGNSCVMDKINCPLKMYNLKRTLMRRCCLPPLSDGCALPLRLSVRAAPRTHFPFTGFTPPGPTVLSIRPHTCVSAPRLLIFSPDAATRQPLSPRYAAVISHDLFYTHAGQPSSPIQARFRSHKALSSFFTMSLNSSVSSF